MVISLSVDLEALGEATTSRERLDDHFNTIFIHLSVQKLMRE